MILIFNGSPKKGFSYNVVNNISSKYDDVVVVNAYDKLVKPCIDCDYCSKHVLSCCFTDMDEIYDLVAKASVILIVSPVHVGSLSGPLINILSRMQIYFVNSIVKGNDYPFAKKLGFGITFSGKSWANQDIGIQTQLKHALIEMNCDAKFYYYITNTDDFDVAKTDEYLQEFYEEFDYYVKSL